MTFLRWMLDHTKALIDKITKVVNEMIGAPAKEKEMDSFGGMLKSTLMLSMVVLLVIVVTRARRA